MLKFKKQNKLNNDITNHKTKVNIYNDIVKDHNNGKEINVEKMKQLSHEIETLTQIYNKRKMKSPTKSKILKERRKT